MATRVFTAHVPTELAEQVDLWAARNDRPRGWVVKQALMNWVEREERRDKLTREAMDDVRAGHVVDHAEIVAWVASLDRNDPPP